MNKAMERRYRQENIKGAIEAYRLDGLTDEDIIAKVISHFGVTRDYVLALMESQVA